jgi:hypothetical protein
MPGDNLDARDCQLSRAGSVPDQRTHAVAARRQGAREVAAREAGRTGD